MRIRGSSPPKRLPMEGICVLNIALPQPKNHQRWVISEPSAASLCKLFGCSTCQVSTGRRCGPAKYGGKGLKKKGLGASDAWGVRLSCQSICTKSEQCLLFHKFSTPYRDGYVRKFNTNRLEPWAAKNLSRYQACGASPSVGTTWGVSRNSSSRSARDSGISASTRK